MNTSRALRAVTLSAVLAVVGGVAVGVPSAGAASAPAPVPTATGGTGLTDTALTWGAVPGAVGYEVQVANTPDFDDKVLSGTAATTAWPVPTTVPAGDYDWRVRATTADGPGAWSDTETFTRSWDSAPSGTRVLQAADTPTVAWDPLPGASFYEVEFSSEPYDQNPSAMEGREDDRRWTCYTQHTVLSPYGAAAGTERLPGDEGNCTFASAGEDPRLETLRKDYDACDAQVTDAAGVTSPAYLTCRRAAVDKANATSPMAAHKFFPLVDLGTGTPLPWYWRVRGRNGSPDTTASPFDPAALSCTGVWNGAGGTRDSQGKVTMPIPSSVPKYAPTPECGSWSAVGSFFVQPTPADEVVTASVTGAGVSPLGASGSLTATPYFSWAPVDGAAKYRVYVSRTRDLRSADHVWETNGTSLSPYGSLADAPRLYWGVQACGWRICGQVTPMSFVKRATSPVKAQSLDATPAQWTLHWRTQSDSRAADAVVPATDSEAKAYQVQVALNGTAGPDWSKPAVDTTVDRVGLPGEPLTTSRASIDVSSLADGSYSWRVRALDEGGGAYPWSLGEPVYRDVSVPKAVVATTAGFAQTAPLAVSFTEPVVKASVTVTAAGRAVAGTVGGSGTSSWTFTPAKPWVTGQSYVLTATGGSDPAGNVAAPVTATLRAATTADAGTPALSAGRASKAWRSRTASDAVGKSFLVTSGKASLATTVVGTNVAVYACRSPRGGTVRIALDRKQVAVVDLYRGWSGCGLVWSKATKSGAHAVSLTALAAKDRRSAGTVVGIDAVTTR
ncbi:hypothetical protein CLV35_1465 [Motilibacter peucedani]|uniref:Fibronectin type-III domain-containing protein n=1 Tax=Motilibacter peucedani TaxID=598650 RepID=A0A420XSI8_9ACTN|nr:Ig-like domain-containing protein [Motilibacter peucedani]RKS77767.1 hypothetical protein CLV35_1465 [Motilibacter peucedani]